MGGMVLPYTFPQKQTFGFDAQQIGHQMWRKVGHWMVPKNSPKLAVDCRVMAAADGDTSDGSGRCWTASDLRSGWLNLLKVRLGQVQILGRGLQIFMVFGIEPARIS